ncbi:hypothetical protein GCM10007989_16020 [Devosia pacifica]|uniref:YjiS-like domain-containing protein n=1 Tax=Devosia pacifica TaxID=1335967 RepID=A0A918VTD7_9HYPH|nr:DUF1127 domain-containing protein [Devosia pacifica]GHA21478.1 hypothetical protein GCM10007989_16020 [Devosia pacifica]
MINPFDTWREKRHIRMTQQQLYGLSDRLLDDIGLTRDEIARVGRNGLPRRGQL